MDEEAQVLWYLHEILIETRSLGKPRLQSKQLIRHCTRFTQAVKLSEDLVDTPLSDPPLSIHKSKFHFFSPQNMLGWEHYRLRMQDMADYLPSSPSLWSATGATQKTTQYTISSQTEELMRQAAVYSSITDSLVASLLEHIPEENRTKIIQEEVKIMAKASRKGVVWVVAVTSNLQLIRWDVALGNLRLQDDHDARARTAPFDGKNLLGPNIKEFDAKIFTMREQHSLHRGLTTHFKVPKNLAPKAAGTSRLSVHQRLGPPIKQEGR